LTIIMSSSTTIQTAYMCDLWINYLWINYWNFLGKHHLHKGGR